MYQPGPRQLQFTHLLIAAMAVLPLVPLLGAPLLADERVLFYEARKFVALDPWAPFQLPIENGRRSRHLNGGLPDSDTPSRGEAIVSQEGPIWVREGQSNPAR